MLAALALLACAWFGLGIRQSHEEARADALVHAAGTPTGAQTATILRLLDSASTLNPDRNIDLLRSEAEVRAGQAAIAERQLMKVIRDEPMNVDAWIELGFAARRIDPTVASLAAARVRELAPPVPPAW